MVRTTAGSRSARTTVRAALEESMTTRWRPDFDPEHLYFLTTTAANHTRIFQRDVVKRILVDGLYFISLMNRVQLFAFVVMPNHMHGILQCPPDCPPGDWVRAFKTSTAQLIVRLYQVENNQPALDALAALVTRPDKQGHKVWEDNYFAENVVTPEFLAQKLAYIHNNPVQDQWLLADSPEAYAWSSARFYLEGKPGLIAVQDVRECLG